MTTNETAVWQRIETWIVSLVAVFTSAAAYVMDWNVTHIYNSAWPAHAKFHNGQTMSMGLLLGISALVYLWHNADASGRFATAVLLAALYWVTQASAILYPGAATIDPEFKATSVWQVAGFPVQILVDIAALSLLGLAVFIRSRRVRTLAPR